MKKKIIYISGADVFDVNDVRTAFEEVRNTLNLDSDTILFGVPVDENETVGAKTDEPIVQDEIPVVSDSDNTTDSPDETRETEIPQSQDTEPVVPILSVLASKDDKTTDSSEIQTNDVVDMPDNMTNTPECVELSDANVTDVGLDITEQLDSDMPVDSAEKTLEELLETMEPLREDVHVVDETPKQEQIDDVDATLENLASEFVKNEDKMPIAKKTSERGKIGRLKNILPFKKMKKDDSGLMGDLFGWAGIAANDEDFSMPGFFTNVASKK